MRPYNCLFNFGVLKLETQVIVSRLSCSLAASNTSYVCSHILVIGIRKYKTSGRFMVTVTTCKTKTLPLLIFLSYQFYLYF